ncbi:MAG: nucleoside phosphorylase [Sphaerochaetaceae bacterium]|nr:nucleoside phosphorylase [Sphaerochaetaceae bacterium]
MLDFFNEEGVFSPAHLFEPDSSFPKTIILTWQSDFEKELKRRFAVQTFPKKFCVGGTYVTVYIFEFQKKQLGFAVIPASAPIVSMLMEEMSVAGAEKFVFIGSCGYLLGDKTDTLIVPDRALRDEGTSYHYIESDSDMIEVQTASYTEQFLRKIKVPYRTGATWTTDAVYRETPSAIKAAKEKGCICVEMECSGIMACAMAKGLKAYQILFTADKFSSEGWKKGRLKYMSSDSYGTYFAIVTELAAEV